MRLQQISSIIMLNISIFVVNKEAFIYVYEIELYGKSGRLSETHETAYRKIFKYD